MGEKIVCPVCGNDNFVVHLTATDHLVSGEIFQLKRCVRCSLVLTSDPPEERDLGQYYLSEDYISHSDRKKSITEVLFHLARRFMLRRKFSLIKDIAGSKIGDLLDIGSGTGYFAGFMKEKGWDVTGIEISERARQYSFSKFGVEALPPDQIDSLTDKKFDCITLWHVLEHFYDPASWLDEIRRLLKDEGKCIVAVPNIDSSDSKWFGCNWAALDVPRHLWHFSVPTLTGLASGHGFRVIRQKPMFFDLFYISILSYKNQRKKLPLIRGVLTGSFLATRNLFRNGCASSVIFVLEKSAG